MNVIICVATRLYVRTHETIVHGFLDSFVKHLQNTTYPSLIWETRKVTSNTIEYRSWKHILWDSSPQPEKFLRIQTFSFFPFVLISYNSRWTHFFSFPSIILCTSLSVPTPCIFFLQNSPRRKKWHKSWGGNGHRLWIIRRFVTWPAKRPEEYPYYSQMKWDERSIRTAGVQRRNGDGLYKIVGQWQNANNNITTITFNGGC